MTARRFFLLIEALLHLAAARLALGVLPFRMYERLLKTRSTTDPGLHATTARAVGSAVHRIAGIVPWRSDCLIQATAAQWMLRRRKVPTRLHIGVAPEQAAVSAHAWLVYESHVLTGRRGHTRFRTIHVY
jgi:Transglutaminase-like superfamily